MSFLQEILVWIFIVLFVLNPRVTAALVLISIAYTYPIISTIVAAIAASIFFYIKHRRRNR